VTDTSSIPLVGLTLGHTGESIRDSQRYASAAERAGLDLVGFGDSQTVFRELYGELMACALVTDRIRLGSVVTNCVTRLPAVTASAIATVAEIAAGRTFLGLGTGQSATANAGVTSGTVAQLRRYVRNLRALQGRPAQTAGEDSDAADSDPVPLAWAAAQVPIMVHSSGPRSAEVAAELADGILLRRGDLPEEELPNQIATLRRRAGGGAAGSGGFQVWMYTPGMVSEDAERARAQLAPLVSARTMTMREAACPSELRAALAGYRAEYDYATHASPTDQRNVRALQRHGLYAYALQRYGLISDPTEMLAQLRSLRGAGVDGVIFGGAVREKDEFIAALSALKAATTEPQV
jgi:5,10-methylenetetrahydromethanopterin reductase